MKIEIIHWQSPTFDDAFVEFHVRQRDCYAAFGAESAAPIELPDPASTTLIAALTEGGEIVGGVRFLRRSPEAPLPLERIAARFGVHVSVPCGDVAEAGALWADRRLQGTGAGRMLAESTIALAPFLRIDMIMILAHQFYHCLRPAGYVPVPELPPLPYPDDRYVSRVQVCEPGHVPWAAPDRRSHIFRMRQEWAAHGFLRCGAISIPQEVNHEQAL
ncbi:MAG TPA: GNAT family N-acetyltransferase [Haliangium sp.]|nr:GNAT family N-acetyltransferase [Haliangium sp.]